MCVHGACVCAWCVCVCMVRVCVCVVRACVRVCISRPGVGVGGETVGVGTTDRAPLPSGTEEDRGGGSVSRNSGYRFSLHKSLSLQHFTDTVSVVLVQKVGFQSTRTQPKSVLTKPSACRVRLTKQALIDVSMVQVHSSHLQSLSAD